MQHFKIKNYTSKVPVETTIIEVEQILIAFGANKIMKEYFGDGRIKLICFNIGKEAYKLPANAGGVEEMMRTNRNLYSQVSPKNLEEQSERVAWRLIKDWLHSQLSLIATKQAMPDQVLLPYLYDGKRTLYEAYKEGTLQVENKPVS